LRPAPRAEPPPPRLDPVQVGCQVACAGKNARHEVAHEGADRRTRWIGSQPASQAAAGCSAGDDADGNERQTAAAASGTSTTSRPTRAAASAGRTRTDHVAHLCLVDEERLVGRALPGPLAPGEREPWGPRRVEPRLVVRPAGRELAQRQLELAEARPRRGVIRPERERFGEPRPCARTVEFPESDEPESGRRLGVPGGELERAPVRAPAPSRSPRSTSSVPRFTYASALVGRSAAALQVRAPRRAAASRSASPRFACAVAKSALIATARWKQASAAAAVPLALAHDAEVVPALRVMRVDREPRLQALLGVLEIPQRRWITPCWISASGSSGRSCGCCAAGAPTVQVAGLVVAEAEAHARVAKQGWRAATSSGRAPARSPARSRDRRRGRRAGTPGPSAEAAQRAHRFVGIAAPSAPDRGRRRSGARGLARGATGRAHATASSALPPESWTVE
jgi:hypothetical protein